jgi:hypothetical protein
VHGLLIVLTHPFHLCYDELKLGQEIPGALCYIQYAD